jgi:hypothetical protein
MAMSSAHQNVISNASKLAKAMLEIEGEIAQLDALWNGVPAYGTAVTQADIDTVASFAGAGLTKAQVDDVIYSLKIARDSIMGNLPSMAVVAHLP